MATLTRRAFVSSSVLAAGAAATLPASAQDAGASIGSATVEQALQKRQSIRNYGLDDIEEEQLTRLLWAAGGINRPEGGGRTAPSWHTANDTDIYIARETGVGMYDVEAGSIEEVNGDDILGIVSPQGFVGRAPVVLIYVSRKSRLAAAAGEAAQDEQALAIAAHVNAAMMAQNVYLFCAAEGLGTCLVGGADRAAIAEALALSEDDVVAYVQPVGHPR